MILRDEKVHGVNVSLYVTLGVSGSEILCVGVDDKTQVFLIVY